MLLTDLLIIPTERLHRIYLINLPLGIMMIILGAIIKRRAKNSPHLLFITAFFICIGLGPVSNAIYVRFDSLLLQTIGNKIAISLITIGAANLAMFLISLKVSMTVFRVERIPLYEAIWVALTGVYFLIPIQFGEFYTPIWPPAFLIYSILLTQSSFVICLIFARKTWKIMEDPVVKKRLLIFTLGVCCIQFVLYDAYLVNGQILNSTLLGALGSIFTPVGILLIYYGIGKDIRAKVPESEKIVETVNVDEEMD